MVVVECFNRNIVECKSIQFNSNAIRINVLIETLWNVNTNIYKYENAGKNVLIETLWNVNTVRFRSSSRTLGVLIETLWNVNHQPRVNRT